MNKLVRRLGECVVLAAFIAGIIHFNEREVQLQIIDEKISIVIETGIEKVCIYPTYITEQDTWYFILPSFVKDDKVFFENVNENISIDNNDYDRFDVFCWEEDKIYTLSIKTAVDYKIAFKRSANLPTMFITTQSGSLEYLDEDKENAEGGLLQIFSEGGMLQYDDSIKKIHERGNSTFSAWKRSYTVTLENSESLCGLEAGQKWNLLGLFYEHDKIHSKIVYDMGRYLGLDYTSDSTWVDLYCNGEYKGLYLLTEAVKVGEGRVEIHDLEEDNKEVNDINDWDELIPIEEGKRAYYDIDSPENITGGYLIEKDLSQELNPKEAYFTTEKSGYTFVIRSPKHTSKYELEYISSFVQNIENLILDRDLRYRDYIDIESFAKQFLIDEIVLEGDSMKMSTYYYIDRNENILKSGPLWDYDRSMGEAYTDYESTIESSSGGMSDWYLVLYEDELFKQELIQNFEKLLPYMKKLLDEDIDGYAELLADSVDIDVNLLHQYDGGETRSYNNYDSYIRYLKYFLASRLNYLIDLWGVEYEYFAMPETMSTIHQVVFLNEYGETVTSYQVADGDVIETLPQTHDDEILGWQWIETEKFYDSQIPVYEDMVLVEKTYTDHLSYSDYRIQLLQEQKSLDEYMDMLDEDIFSYVVVEQNQITIVDNNQWLQETYPISDKKQSITTTFGLLEYGLANGETYLYIQENEINYLENGSFSVKLILVKKNTGEIVDVRDF